MIFFTSDQHYFHPLMARERGFLSTYHMNEWLISIHNHRIRKNDQVYILGDFSIRGSKEKVKKLLDRLNGKLFLIKGNHDNNRVTKQDRWQQVYDTLMLKTRDNQGNRVLVWLSHYAHLAWPQKHYGALHLFGHSHGKLINPLKGSMDIGVDTKADLAPYSLAEILKAMEKNK